MLRETVDLSSDSHGLETVDVRRPKETFRSRPLREGPESELVTGFIDTIQRSPARKGTRVTFFREARIESGFPDLVAVKWDDTVHRYWPEARLALRDRDFRVLQALRALGPSRAEVLAPYVGLGLKGCLARLQAAELINQRGRKYSVRSLRSIYAVKSIVAFEAKMTDWRSAIMQASLNRWFASESYVLIPAEPHKVVVDAAMLAGVGIWVKGFATPHLKSPADIVRQPLSYASWLFNDWSFRLMRESR